MRGAAVAGAALWAQGFRDLEAFLAGAHDPSVTEPPADVASPRVKRGTSLLTRMQLEVAAGAGRAAGLDLRETPTVFGSCHGEIQIALHQLDMMREGDGVVSPHRFKNSVHNTGSGVYAIATGNTGFTTAIAAGPETVATCLLEALTQLASGAPAVIVALADEALPAPLERFGSHAPLGVGLALRSPRVGPALGVVSDLRLARGSGLAAPGALAHARLANATDEVAGRLARNPMAPAAALLRALREGASGPFSLGGGARPWVVTLGASP